METTTTSDLFRELPSVDEIIRAPGTAALVQAHGVPAVTDAARTVLTHLRNEISSGLLDDPALRLALSGIGTAVEAQLRHIIRHSLRPVINATGVILHTNLGRAPLSKAALAHIEETVTGYSNLEFNLETGDRGK